MRPRFAPLAATAALLLFVPIANATTLRPHDVTCPVCEKEIVVLVWGSTNSFGGQDRDLCTHAAGANIRRFTVWTCPHCYYSADRDGFEEGGPAKEIAARVRKELRPTAPISPDSSQYDIPGREKYLLAGTILEWEGAPPMDLADHWLEAAWTTRCEMWKALGPYRGNGAFEEIRTRLDDEFEEFRAAAPSDDGASFPDCRRDLDWASGLLARAEEKALPPKERAVLRIEAAAFILNRGEHLTAEPVLARLVEEKEIHEDVRTAAKGLLAEIGWERRFQEKFLACAKRAFDEDPPGEREQSAVAYIAGDTCRRLGRAEEAAGWLRRSLGFANGPLWAIDLAREDLELLGVADLSEKEIAATRAKRVSATVERLADPETTNSAAEELRSLKDKATEPLVAKLLTSGDPDVRNSAALVLMDMPEPTDATVDALCARLGDEAEVPRWRAAVALERIGAFRSRAAVEKAFDAEEEERVYRVHIGTLGFVGEKETLPLLLTAYYVEERRVLAALRRLANREVPDEFETREALLEWWGENLPGTRRDWVKRGFAEVGVEIGDPGSRDAVPALLDLLDHEKPWIRANAVRCLREISGRRLPWDDIASPFDYPRAIRERNAAIAKWRAWWKSEGGK